MEINKFVQQVESSIDGLQPGVLAAGTQFRQLTQWDSLSALNLIAMASSEYNVDLTAGELKACITVQELFDKIKAKAS